MSERTQLFVYGAVVFVIGMFTYQLIDTFLIDQKPIYIKKVHEVFEFIPQLDYSNISSIIIDNGSVEFMNAMYWGSVKEVQFCIYGVENDSIIRINRVKESKMTERTEKSVISKKCDESLFDYSEKLLGTIHTHPGNYNYFSDQDFYSFGYGHNLISGIMYGKNEFLIYVRGEKGRIKPTPYVIN